MKKITKLSFLIFVPILLGVILAVAGGVTNNDVLYRVGIDIATYGSAATAFILVVVCLILMITGRASDSERGGRADREIIEEPEYAPETRSSDSEEGAENAESDGDGNNLTKNEESASDTGENGADSGETDNLTETAEEAEERKIAEINSSYGYESRQRYGEYQMNASAEIYKRSSPKEKVLGWLFFGFLMTCFALTAVFLILGIVIGAIICGALFAGTIIISLIVKKILEGVSKSPKADPDKWTETKGTVVACLFSSSSSTGGGNRNSTVRVSNVTYRIIVRVDGKEYNGYSSRVYEEGQEISVFVRRNGKGNLVKIADDE